MRTIKLIIEYDGSNYCGWQIQPNGPTIQGELEKAVFALTGNESRVEGSGRTDSGVHALAQVAHFLTDSDMPGEAFSRALNAHLPKDISVRESMEATGDFHARFSALGKVYRYEIENAATRPALDFTRVWWVSWELDENLLNQATLYILGEHDFTSFADAERDGGDNIRTVERAEWRREGRRLSFEIEGNGFLYKMVRCLVGTLVEVGRGKISPDEFIEILQKRDRTAAGPTAPPAGLHLVRVNYPAGM
ncbi:MAG: tRNA pseudouridine(38-40) synthase TruA [Planctomycetes bacterium]|nr:tRNA pseudouridine(38-40) synthase TruA [Planctomycetota bacterium]